MTGAVETATGTRAERRRFPSGTRIFNEGDKGDYAYVIERGKVEISFARAGETVQIAVLGPGEIFGEMALIDDRARSASATALVDTEVVLVHSDQIQNALSGADLTVRLLLQVLLGRFRAMQGRIYWASPDDDAVAELSALDADQSDERQRAIDRLRFEQELRSAIDEGAFRMLLQPIVSLSEGTVAGFEALIRWDHEKRGYVPPQQFIEVAETTQLIKGIDRWTCSKVADLLREMDGGTPTDRPPFISVNLSGLSLSDRDFMEMLGQTVSAAGIDPRRFAVEITEGVLIDNPNMVSEALERLAAFGAQIALDDFGTGYSSLSYLVGFPIGLIKIDRAFVIGMRESQNSLEIVRAIIGMGHALNMKVVAEGVEEAADLETLWRLGCDYAQGYYLSKPLEPDSAIAVARRGPVLSMKPTLLPYGAYD